MPSKQSEPSSELGLRLPDPSNIQDYPDGWATARLVADWLFANEKDHALRMIDRLEKRYKEREQQQIEGGEKDGCHDESQVEQQAT